ncbi:2-oxoglutarate ferredoxin oxidoreductase subunit delta [Clostridium cavendishii DSM 21758]|uniref:2-oxoglutarate ferredoxin oxidoreductase subunit delta n=1 Tax=Clostridium cavendishii DSM 21758 TaxID=1121302 RepID=A0A1M6LXR3_9CLOT|nr:4Fe-4S dicluster domain-containing protein [Clostridium cavendishii]SHJ75955.1 2-oxoglutarate ferredoxin oxidoreductase subunit delta [Clostridium cavendishii DSM 21758]
MAKVTFREDRCKGCGHCILACPKSIISFSSKLNEKGYHPAQILKENISKCIGCASCGRMCPDLVITVER